MVNCSSALGTDFRATTPMGPIIRTALTPTISHTGIVAITIGLIIGTLATVTTATIITIIITTTIKLR